MQEIDKKSTNYTENDVQSVENDVQTPPNASHRPNDRFSWVVVLWEGYYLGWE